MKHGQVFAGKRLRRVHAGDAVPAKEVNKLLLAHRLYLAGLDGLRGHLVRNIGKNRAQPHHVARAGDLENHGLAIAGGRGDFYLAKTDDKDVSRRIALGKQLGPPGMAHHDANPVIIAQCLGREIAEHSQMAMLTVDAIFRRVMGVERGHKNPQVKLKYSAISQCPQPTFPRCTAGQGFPENFRCDPGKPRNGNLFA